jgi:hypothetical protein
MASQIGLGEFEEILENGDRKALEVETMMKRLAMTILVLELESFPFPTSFGTTDIRQNL